MIDKRYFKSTEKVIHNGFFFLPRKSIFLETLINRIKKDYLYFQDIIFTHPKQGIMNLTGPHQFTRSYYELKDSKKPILVTQGEINWIYCSKYGEFISPFKFKKHYSLLKNGKTIDSEKMIDLK